MTTKDGSFVAESPHYPSPLYAMFGVTDLKKGQAVMFLVTIIDEDAGLHIEIGDLGRVTLVDLGDDTSVFVKTESGKTPDKIIRLMDHEFWKIEVLRE